MSAFFVGTDHIDAMLSYYSRCAKYGILDTDGQLTSTSHDDDMLTRIGRALILENMESLQARYPLSWQELVDIDTGTEYRFTFDPIAVKRPNVHAFVLKLCACYAYQSCEHDGWAESYAKRVVDDIRDTAISLLPGYDDAPWSYDRPVLAHDTV